MFDAIVNKQIIDYLEKCVRKNIYMFAMIVLTSLSLLKLSRDVFEIIFEIVFNKIILNCK